MHVNMYLKQFNWSVLTLGKCWSPKKFPSVHLAEAQNGPICARFLCTKGHFWAGATAATAASDPNQSFQGRVWTPDSGWKHLVGFKYAGWGLLHRPKDGSLLQLRTLFVHLSQAAILGPPPAPPIEIFDANQSFQGRVYALDVGSKHLVGFRYACGRLLHRRENSLLALLCTWGIRPFRGRRRRLSTSMTPTKVFKVEYSH